MPGIANHQSAQTTKLLFIGDSGRGKTGALASLACAGYKLRIIDTDNGLDVLKSYLTHPDSIYVKKNPRCAENVHYVTLTNPRKNMGGRLVPTGATVWPRLVQLLTNWEDGEHRFGPVASWGTDTILCLDSLTTTSSAALDFVLSMNGRLGQRPQLQDWGAGQDLVEDLVETFYDDGVKCNIIVNCHITYIGEEGGMLQGYPNTLGKALPPKIGRYFNTALLARSVGTGPTAKRTIVTNTSGLIGLKNTAPMVVKPEYSLEWGLAEYFAAVRGTPAVVAPIETKVA